MPDEPTRLHFAVSRWFQLRGLTSLLDGTAFRRTTSVRALPAMIAFYLWVVVFELPAAADRRWLTWAIPLLAIVVTWIGANLVRRRPAFAAIQRVGWFEAACFVAVPGLVTLITPHAPPLIGGIQLVDFSDRWFDAVWLTITQVLILALILLVTRMGLVSTTLWLTREVVGSLATSGTALARSLPLLLVVVTFSFFTAELWQTIGQLTAGGFFTLIALFACLGFLFLRKGHRFDMLALQTFQNSQELRTALDHTPFKGRQVVITEPVVCQLTPHQERAARRVASVSRLVLSSVVGVMVFAFFLLLGFMVVDAAAIQTWTTNKPEPIATLGMPGRTLVLTWEQIQVAGFLGTFAAFYYAVISATDANLREGILDTAEDSVREACAVKTVIELDAGFTPTNPGAR